MTIKADNKNKEKHVNWKEMEKMEKDEEEEVRRTRKKREINKTLEQN
jgi:hypothetical protein